MCSTTSGIGAHGTYDRGVRDGRLFNGLGGELVAPREWIRQQSLFLSLSLYFLQLNSTGAKIRHGVKRGGRAEKPSKEVYLTGGGPLCYLTRAVPWELNQKHLT